MRRGATMLFLLALVLSAAGSAAARPLVGQKTTKITIWVGWAGATHELGVFKKVVAEYDRKHADVSVNVVGNINDAKITAAIRAGHVPDVVSSFNSYDVGAYCGTGAWIDLGPLLQQSHINASMFPSATQYYTQFNGKRCALPLLADTY